MSGETNDLPVQSVGMLVWPPVTKTKSGWELRAKFLTPLGFHAWTGLVLEPITLVWKLAAFVLILAYCLGGHLEWLVFRHLPFGYGEATGVLAALYLLRFWELRRVYPIGRFFCGQVLRIVLQDGDVLVGSRRSFRRIGPASEINFALKKFELEADVAWKHSAKVQAILGQAGHLDIAEVFSRGRGISLVSNANLMLLQSESFALQSHDIDPTRFDDLDSLSF